MSEAARFLQTVFDYKPEGAHILVWTWPDRISYWTRDLEKAAAYAERRAPEVDVYFGVGLAERAYQADQRLKKGEREAAGMYGVWADIDIAGAGHADKPYPPTLADALLLVDDVGLQPTCIIHSGGGLHVHWVFKEPWMFSDDADRQAGRILAWRFSRTLRERASRRGWYVDSVPDLERVLRIPGTLNHKLTESLPVHLL
jgi:hypothetical protein